MIIQINSNVVCLGIGEGRNCQSPQQGPRAEVVVQDFFADQHPNFLQNVQPKK